MSLKKEHEAVLVGPVGSTTIPIKINWADGMIGALPVFDNKKDAVAYAGGKYVVMQVAEVGTDIEEITDTDDPGP
jgi:hypothetical protein